MSVALKRGWCPSLFRPMESGDGWLARIRPQEGALDLPLVRALALAAARYGNGLIEVTNRANLQIRGLRPEGIASFTEAMVAAGAADPDEAAEARANILVSPLLGVDPGVAAGTARVVRGLRRGLADPAFAALPAKFGFLVDGGGALPLDGIGMDITLRALPSGQWRLGAGGDSLTLDIAGAAARALRIAATFLGRKRLPTARGDRRPRLGFVAFGNGETGSLLVAPPFGQMQAEQFAALGDLAQRHADGALRPTPWKAIAIGGVPRGDAAALAEAATALGFIAVEGDPRQDIVTCAGAGRCSRGSVETHTAATWLAARRPAGAPLLHLSGCIKGCAYPDPAPLVLVGRDGQLDHLRHGRPGDVPFMRGLSLEQGLATLGREEAAA